MLHLGFSWSLCMSFSFEQFVKMLSVNFSHPRCYPMLADIFRDTQRLYIKLQKYFSTTPDPFALSASGRPNAASNKHIWLFFFFFAASLINLPTPAFIKSWISWFWHVTLARTGKATPSRVIRTAAAICRRWFICLLPLLQSKQLSTISYQERRMRSDDAPASRPLSLWAPADGKVLNY